MTDLHSLIQNGSANVWLYIPVAILLGALHGLEPGHSKTMMAAFIIAIRGTVWQAVLLGLAAAFSHSLLIWLLAGLALKYGNQWNAEDSEPYFQLASAVLILGIALWMYLRTRRELREAQAHAHSPTHEHKPTESVGTVPVAKPALAVEPDLWRQTSHSHASPTPATLLQAGEIVSAGGLILPAEMSDHPVVAAPSLLAHASAPLRQSASGPHGGVLLDTGHGWLEISLVQAEEASRFHIYPCRANGQPVPMPKGTALSVETARLDGGTQKFQFTAQEGCWESTTTVPTPHDFLAVITLGHADHAHTYKLRFTADHHRPIAGPTVSVEPEDDGLEYQDAHERAHAQDIAKRFANRTVTTPQIILFGLTGGLMPCPAAFTILLLCLQMKRTVLGFAMVGAFSFGLALTMVTVGAVAAWSVQHAEKRFRGFGDWMRRAPFISCAMLVILASYMAWSGWQGLHGHAH